MMNNFSKIGAVVLLALVVSFICSFPVMLLWNLCLVPAVPSLVEIGWIQAWGIMLLCEFLFKDNSVKFNTD